jgi:DNA (cytosine-5)-methyltransferase 1
VGQPFTFYEFFAGGGMARIGLGDRWRCAFANDFDPVKAAAYRLNFTDAQHHLREADVWTLSAGDLPGQADLAWASSPCQDFSLAGARAGLGGGRSSAFFGFWRLMEALDDAGRAPGLVVIENVTGLLTSRGGADFTALGAALAARGYRFGALEIDASAFTPQSRPRIFVIAARSAPAELCGDSPFHTRGIRAAQARLDPATAAAWAWWRLPPPPGRNTRLEDLLLPDGEAVWRSTGATEQLTALMAPRHRARLAPGESRAIGAVFRRTRREAGRSVQRAEARFDGLAGCLRTPRGGSSRQSLLVVEPDGRLRSRLIAPREAARLMGLPDDYRLPVAVTAALHVVGDGVVAPVVRWLAAELLEPLAEAARTDQARGATPSKISVI